MLRGYCGPSEPSSVGQPDLGEETRCWVWCDGRNNGCEAAHVWLPGIHGCDNLLRQQPSWLYGINSLVSHETAKTGFIRRPIISSNVSEAEIPIIRNILALFSCNLRGKQKCKQNEPHKQDRLSRWLLRVQNPMLYLLGPARSPHQDIPSEPEGPGAVIEVKDPETGDCPGCPGVSV